MRHISRPQEGLRAYLEKINYTPATPIGDLFCPMEFVELAQFTCIPFTSQYLLSTVAKLIHRANSACTLLFDFTHDACKERLKLGSISICGLHFSKGDWRNSACPFFWSIVDQESDKSIHRTLEACVAYVKKTTDIDLQGVVVQTVLDGNPSLANNCATFPKREASGVPPARENQAGQERRPSRISCNVFGTAVVARRRNFRPIPPIAHRCHRI